MAKLELPIIVNCTEIDELIDEIKHLQTYKLFEGDEQVLIDRDSVIEIFAKHIRASAQPDVPDISVGDMISRQEAVDALDKLDYTPGEWAIKGLTMCKDAIKNLHSAQPEQDMVDDLTAFIEREKGKENRPLRDWVVQWILEELISGKCKITGSATSHSKMKMYVEFSFYQEEQDG